MIHFRGEQRTVGLMLAAVFSLACGLLPRPVPTPPRPPPPPPRWAPTTGWQGVVDAFVDLNHSQRLPDHLMQENPEKDGSEFDVNAYFDVLDHLSMEPGYVLDYVYRYDGMGGSPVLFTRPEDQSSPTTYAEYAAALEAGDAEEGYLHRVQVDGSEEGFFQFVVLYEIGGQFYLFWHANYFDTVIICDPKGIEDIISRPDDFGNPFTRKQKREARAIDPAPVVKMGEDSVVVEVVMFSNWGGFVRGTYEISKSFPHTVLNSDYEVLVEYDCGIMF
jgi:hypothetical protein